MDNKEKEKVGLEVENSEVVSENVDVKDVDTPISEEASIEEANEKGVETNEKEVDGIEEEEKHKTKKSPLLIALLLLLLLFGFSIALIGIANHFNLFGKDKDTVTEGGKDSTMSLDVDDSVTYGDLSGKTKEEIQAELNNKVEEGMMNVSMNTNIVLENSKSKANLLIKNSDKNRYMQFVEIYNDKKELIYKSGGIPVGGKLEEAKLSKELPKGEHKCVAYFNAYDDKTSKVVGKVGVNITINVVK